MTVTNVAAIPEGGQCDVTIFRAATGAIQTFTLRTGGLLRIGRGVANDIVLDVNGVSVYHAELYLRPPGPGESTQILCIRDDSKHGTGVRAGPHAPDSNVSKPPPSWETLEKGQLRVLDHGWEVICPMLSRKDNSQLPESWRVLTIYTGTKIGPLMPDTELDGEIREPESLKDGKLLPQDVPPPSPDVGGGAFEAPLPPDAQAKKRKLGDGRAEGAAQDKADSMETKCKSKPKKHKKKQEVHHQHPSKTFEEEVRQRLVNAETAIRRLNLEVARQADVITCLQIENATLRERFCLQSDGEDSNVSEEEEEKQTPSASESSSASD